MNKEVIIVAAVACIAGVGTASLLFARDPVSTSQAAFMISSSDNFAAPAGPSIMEVMLKRSRASLAEFASTDTAAKLAQLAERNQGTADAAIKKSASACITERAGVELPKYQQTMMSEGVSFLVQTALAAGTPRVVSNDINATAETYMRQHGSEVMEDIQNATVKQLNAAQALMNEIAREPKFVMLCTAERAVKALATG